VAVVEGGCSGEVFIHVLLSENGRFGGKEMER